MEIIVGRKGEQPFPISDRTVSGKHLRLTTMSDGNVLVEDLCSSNGTFIDNIRVSRKVVPSNTIIRMGSNYTFRISDVLPEVKSTVPVQQKAQSAIDKKQEVYSIAHLEEIWNQYTTAKDEVDNQNRQIGLIRSATPILNIIPGLGAVLGTYSFYKAKKFNYKEAINEIQERFEDEYVCPKCHHFLGVVKYKLLIQDTNCRFCKCKWTLK